MLSRNQNLDALRLIKTLDKFSETPDYDKRTTRMILKVREMEEKFLDKTVKKFYYNSIMPGKWDLINQE